MTTSLTPGAILEREQRSRHEGSGITAAQLAGTWRLVELWSREASPQPRQAASLRWLQANLQLTPTRAEDGEQLVVVNGVRVGPLALRFCGQGQLTGRRPLLQFSFQTLELLLGDRLLLQRDLGTPAPSRMPFFALIDQDRDADGRWLLARGRGGGLACWRCP
ncbi:MAG: hypothetical protein VKM34_00575 [Cyanobacteriota bacterium]|nr:hypothetical protein [Cyanobacteriota bacterium]